jgi:hypothetical protein
LADETTPATEATTETPAAEQPPEEEVSGASSLEEIEAYWRKRMSNSDKAHAAERKVLEQRLQSIPQGDKGVASEDQSGALAELQKRVQQAEARAKSAELKAKYPAAVDAVGDAVTYMDEARLAALNESLNFDAGRPTRIDTNNPSRSVTTQKPIAEKSVEELLADLKGLAFPTNQ